MRDPQQDAGRVRVAASARRIPRRIRHTAERFVSGHDVRLLRDGEQALPAMLSAIDAARRQVLLEMYWFASDRVGRSFADALGRAAERGVEVAVLYDSVGCWETDPSLFEQMQARGVKVAEYNPVLPYRRRFRLDRLTRRNHRKVLVTDAAVGFTGGINLAAQWAPAAEGGGGWRDDMIEVQGPAVVGMLERFRADWASQGGPELTSVSHGPLRLAGSKYVRVIGPARDSRRREIVRAYLLNVYLARHRVWISNSYFVPAPAMVRALSGAARRGIDVRVLVPSISDVPLMRYASRAVWSLLLRHGVRIYEWQGSMLHSKSAVIDGVWSTIGSFNLDVRSGLLNLETNVAVRDTAFGRVMEQSFVDDLSRSREVDAREFAARSKRERLLEAVLRQFARVL
ncbi:MAG: cardiolipin synthase B [Polyangiaceae bacterium]|nr:cardiolipin synthase B [Polyangiaceae bacterium]